MSDYFNYVILKKTFKNVKGYLYWYQVFYSVMITQYIIQKVADNCMIFKQISSVPFFVIINLIHQRTMVQTDECLWELN